MISGGSIETRPLQEALKGKPDAEAKLHKHLTTGPMVKASSRKEGDAAVARSTNRRTASAAATASTSVWSSCSGMPSDGTWKIVSPGMPSA